MNQNFLTYARSYHNIGDSQWSAFVYYDHDAIISNNIRFYACGPAQVGAVDVDVYRDGIWADVYEGAFAGLQWVEGQFDEGMVTEARIRFYAASANEGFFLAVV
jgi:hypothetical protein